MNEKFEGLLDLLKDLKSVIVAFSGGVDSSVVAYAAHNALGNNAIAVTIDSIILPRIELKNARKIAKEIGIQHLIVKDKINNENFLKNPINRCYFCKKQSIKILKRVAKAYRIDTIIDGTNADDLNDPGRYGLKALEEEKVISPLAEVGLTKKEVRKIVCKLKISNAEKPSMACLASRIPTNERITKERLKKVEKAEEAIKKILKNFNVAVRVRDYKDKKMVRIECSDTKLIFKNRCKIVNELKKLGYEYIALDLQEYRRT